MAREPNGVGRFSDRDRAPRRRPGPAVARPAGAGCGHAGSDAQGGIAGAPARYAGDVLVTSRTDASFPYGTLAVNVIGSFLLGLVTGLALHHGLSSSWQALVGTGFCGALTMYSTFSVEAAGLLRDGRPAAAAANLLGSTSAGLLAAAAGLGLTLL